MRVVHKANSVSKGIRLLKVRKAVHLTAHGLTAIALMIELKNLNIQYIHFKIDKWNHIFIDRITQKLRTILSRKPKHTVGI